MLECQHQTQPYLFHQDKSAWVLLLQGIHKVFQEQWWLHWIQSVELQSTYTVHLQNMLHYKYLQVLKLQKAVQMYSVECKLFHHLSTDLVLSCRWLRMPGHNKGFYCPSMTSLKRDHYQPYWWTYQLFP